MFDMNALAAKVKAKREDAGMNVHFLREDGTKDCFSFADPVLRDAFKAKLTRQGRTIL